MQWDNQEWLDQQEQIHREISSVNRKWQSEELNQKLADGDVKVSIAFEIDYMYQRELRNGCLER